MMAAVAFTSSVSWIFGTATGTEKEKKDKSLHPAYGGYLPFAKYYFPYPY